LVSSRKKDGNQSIFKHLKEKKKTVDFYGFMVGMQNANQRMVRKKYHPRILEVVERVLRDDGTGSETGGDVK